jgi:chorismate synthase
LIEGFPAGLEVDFDFINEQLKRRQGGYGRGARQRIETDKAEFLAGVRFGRTMGSPIALTVQNKDWENWKSANMSIEALPDGVAPNRESKTPRPGHADFAGMLKYSHSSLRPVLERASARNTASLVAVGALCSLLLAEFGVSIFSHVASIGGIKANTSDLDLRDLKSLSEKSPVSVADSSIEGTIIAAIDKAKSDGDTLGGVFEVVVLGLPIGLGSYASWETRLDGRLAQAMMGIQAIKGVEIGLGFGVADIPGSQVHDPFFYSDSDQRFFRSSNNAGGVEGGVTNGEPLIIRAAMKPIATLMKQLPSVNFDTKEAQPAFAERSDVCAVPAAAVVGEAMAAYVLAEAFLDKFGGDSIEQIRGSYDAYTEMVRKRTESASKH